MADRASSPPYLYHRLIMDHYPVLFVRWLNEPASCRIRIRERIHGLFKRRSLSLSLSLARTSDAPRQSIASRALLLRILGRGILSQALRPDATWTKRTDKPLIIGAGGFRKSNRPVFFSMTDPRHSLFSG